MVNDPYGDGAAPPEQDRAPRRPRALVESRMLIELPRPDGGSDYVGLSDWVADANELFAGLRRHDDWAAGQISTLIEAQRERDRAEQENRRSTSTNVRAWRRDMDAELRELRAQVAALSQRLGQTLESVDSLAAALAANSAGGSTRQTDDGIAHHAHAQAYQAVRDQSVRGLLQHVQALDGVPLDHRERAGFVAHLCAELFGPTQATANDILNRLAAQYYVADVERRIPSLCEEVRALREKAARGRAQRWEFSCHPGVAVDPSWQEEWPNAVQDGAVDFVVAPAYIVDEGTVLVHQLVFTTAPDTDA
jgi:hypothetical protein